MKKNKKLLERVAKAMQPYFVTDDLHGASRAAILAMQSSRPVVNVEIYGKRCKCQRSKKR